MNIGSARLRMIASCLFVLCMLAAPASAVAAGHHGAKAHRAKAKKKKKKSATTVLVRCASVTVTCKGKPGATGPQGPAGANGTNGINGTNGTSGANGSAVVLRARSTGSTAAIKAAEPVGCDSFFTCISGGANVALTPSTWIEGPTEDDQMIGSITLSIPSEVACKAEGSGGKLERPSTYIIAAVGGIAEGVKIVAGGSTASTETVAIFGESFIKLELEESGEANGELGNGVFIGSGSSESHTVTLEAIDNCNSTPIVVSNAAIDVLASF